MAIAFVQSQTPATATGNATSTTLTADKACTAGNLLVVALVCQGNDVITSVTDSKGNTWTVGPTIANGTNQGTSMAYTLQDGGAIAIGDTIVAHHTTAPGRVLTCDEFSGVDSTTPTTGSAGTATGSSTAPAATMAGATTDADAMVYGIVGYNGTGTHTADGSFTESNEGLVNNAGVNRKLATEYQIVSATGTYGFTDSLSASGAWSAAVMAFKAAAGGGGPTQFTQACDVSLTINDTIHPFNIRSVGHSTTVGVTASRLNLTRTTLSASAATAMAALRRTLAIRSVSLGTTASLSRRTRKLLSSSLSVLASLATALSGTGPVQYTQECLATIATSVSTSRLSRKLLSGALSLAASVRRATRVAHGASTSLAPSIVRRVGVAHSVSVALSASRRVRVRTVRNVSLAVTASVSRLIRKTFSTTLGTLASALRAVIVPPRNDPQEQSITVDNSLNSAIARGTANSPEVDVSLNSVRIVSSTNTFEVTDG